MQFARPRFVLFGVTCLIALSLTLPDDASAQTTAPPKPTVTIAEATLKTIAHSDTFLGRVEAINDVSIIARVAGFIEKINFKDGSKVSAGDVLVNIEPDAYEAAITQIQGEIQSAQASKTLADIELDRQQKLLAKGDVAENVVQRAQAQQGQADGLILQLQGSLQAAQLDLSYTKVSAPFDGRVGLTSIASGTFVSPESGALLTLSSIDPIYVVFPVANAQLLDFQKQRKENLDNAPINLQLILANGDVYSSAGKIDVIDTSVQAGTDTVLVQGVFSNPDGALLDGQLVRVTATDQPDKKSLTIPTEALQKDQDGYFVLTVGNDGKVAKAPIKIGQVAGTEVVVTDGLKASDQVITEGLQKVRVGMEVTSQPVAAAAPAASE